MKRLQQIINIKKLIGLICEVVVRGGLEPPTSGL